MAFHATGTITRTYGVDAFGVVTTGSATGSSPAFDDINDAIANTDVGGTVNVLEGTYNLTSAVSVNTTSQLNARGGIYRAQPVATASPILYGYESKSFPIYFNQSPVMSVTPRDTAAENLGIDLGIVAARERQRAKVILRYHNTADSLLVSGLLAGGQELAGRAAVVDAPVGKGHVILFGIRPLWRWESQGSFAMPLNAIVNWNHLEF